MISTCTERARATKSSAGTTLIELILVVVILSTLATVAVYSFSNTAQWRRVSSHATSMLGMLRNAHAMAISQSKRVRVNFEATKFYITVEDDPLSAPDIWTAPSGAWSEVFPIDNDVRVDLKNLDDSSVPATITFHPDGRGDPIEITLSHERFADVIKLTVNKVTGQVTLAE